MKNIRRVLIICFAILWGSRIHAVDAFRDKKYRGFVEIGPAVMFENNTHQLSVLINTSHGCQLTDLFFVGAGVGVNLNNNFAIVPLYVVGRLKFIEADLAPYFEAKGGYSLIDFKGVPASRLEPRLRLKDSLDQIYSVKYPKEYIIYSVESKVFGIGLESYTVGNSEFYQIYAAKNNLCCLLDTGHYHPTEVVSDKISSLLCFNDKVALHVSRPVRWDSDHVVILDDELKEIAKEIVRNDAIDKVIIGLDYFDASINRIAAWVIGTRNMQKALLNALLLPHKDLIKLQNEQKFTELLSLNEEYKTLPFGDVWNEFLAQEGLDNNWLEKVQKYEKDVLLKRC